MPARRRHMFVLEYDPDRDFRIFRDLGADGACSRCGTAPPHPGWTYCGPCSQQVADSKKVLRETRRALGVCLECGAPRAVALLCGLCRGKQSDGFKVRYHAARAAGLCVKCGEPSGGPCHCVACRAVHVERLRRRTRQPYGASTTSI